MLSKDGIKARYILTLCFLFASSSGIVSGWAGTACGIMGCMELSSALLGFSPLQELFANWAKNRKFKT